MAALSAPSLMQDVARGKESRQETASQKEKSQEEKGKEEAFKKKKNNNFGLSLAKQSSCYVGSSLSPHCCGSPSSHQPEKQLLQNESSFPARFCCVCYLVCEGSGVRAQ